MANYSDYDLRMATQIAYIDGLDASVKLHPEWTLKEHFENNPGFIETFKSKNPDDPTLYDDLMSGKYADWKIVNIENTNSATGFAACTIDTGDGNAIVGFRGSESTHAVDPAKQIVNDWIIADTGLLNSTETMQQRQAREYLERMVKEHPEYDSFSVTGHSLGGNLAEHATITAKDEVYKKIDRALSLDGPGYSDEYIANHKGDIEKHSGKIDHYQYSFVGALLNPLPGTNYRHMLASEKDGLLFKHGTWNIQYDEDGNMVQGEPDELAKHLYGISNAADDTTMLWGPIGVLEFLFGGKLIFSIPEMIDYYREYNREIKRQMDAHRANMNIDFKVNIAALSQIESIYSQCEIKLNTYADEVNRIKNEINLLIKLGAIYNVGIRLFRSKINIEKLSRYSGKLSAAAENIQELYHRYENSIESNVNGV